MSDSVSKGTTAEASTSGSCSKAEVVLLMVAILSLGALLRVSHISEFNCSFDEGFSRKMAAFGVGETWRRAALDNHPPLYFYLLHLWSAAFGESPRALRLMSVCFGLASIVGAYLLTREIAQQPVSEYDFSARGEIPALFAAILTALTPLQIHLSQEIRMYSLGTALALFASWFLVRALYATVHRYQAWGLYVGAGTLLAYTHYFGLLLLAAHFLYAVGFRLWRGFCDKTSTSDRWSTLAHVFFVFFIIQLLWLPWTPEFLGHRERVANSFWTREFAWDQLGGVCCQLFALTWPGGVPSHSFIWGVGLSYLVFTIALIVFGRHGVRLIGVAVFVTFAGAIGSSLLARNIMSARYFVFAHALLVCGIAIAAAGIHLRLPRNTILVTITAVASWLSWIHIKYRDEVAKRPGMAAAMGYLAEARKSDEPVVVANPMLQIAAVAEAVKPVKVKVLSPTAAFPFFQGTAVMQDDDYLSPAELIGSCVNRFWAIDAVNWTHGTFTVEIPDPWVDVSKEVFPGQLSTASQIIVRCYQRRSAKRESSHVH